MKWWLILRKKPFQLIVGREYKEQENRDWQIVVFSGDNRGVVILSERQRVEGSWHQNDCKYKPTAKILRPRTLCSAQNDNPFAAHNRTLNYNLTLYRNPLRANTIPGRWEHERGREEADSLGSGWPKAAGSAVRPFWKPETQWSKVKTGPEIRSCT